MAYLHQRQFLKAESCVLEATRLQLETPPTAAAALDGYTNIARVYLTLWEIRLQSSRQNRAAGTLSLRDLKRQAGKACTAMLKFARVYPIGQPGYWLCRGLYHWLNGKPELAHQTWQTALSQAERQQMPYETALAHYEIGRHSPLDNAQHRYHLAQAQVLFEALGVQI
jgi:hypothetical protein